MTETTHNHISWNKSVLKEKVKLDGSLPEESDLKAESTALKDSAFTEISDAAEKEKLVNSTGTILENPINKPEDLAKSPDSIRKTCDAKWAIHKSSEEAVIPVRMKKDWSEPLETKEKGPNLFAINALVFAMGYVILSIITIFSNLFALAVICFVAALTFAIIGIIKWKRSKDNFWGTFFAVMAIGLLALGTLVLVVLILAGSI